MKMPREVREALDVTGLPWELEEGSKHWKIKVKGRLAGILPKGPISQKNKPAILNTVSQVRRLARQIKGEK
jgi:hypothetical protein